MSSGGWTIHFEKALEGFERGVLYVSVGIFSPIGPLLKNYSVSVEGPGKIVSAGPPVGPKEWSPKTAPLPRGWTFLCPLNSAEQVSFSYFNKEGEVHLETFYLDKPVYFVKT